MSRTCLYCQKALGCPLLFGKDGRFDPVRLVMEESLRECNSFKEIAGARERNLRARMYDKFGLGYMRVLHELPELVMEGLRQGEKDELMYENMPNFQDPKLLWEGMTTIEREDVLRHQTDENGKVIIEVDSEGVQHKLARPEYHLRAYMTDPDGPIHVSRTVAWDYHTNQVIDYILKAEAELGLIVKVKKPSAATEPPNKPKEESETSMPGPGRQVRTVRTAAPAKAPAAAPAATAAPSAVPARRVTPKGVAPAAAPTTAPAARTPVRAPAPAGAAPGIGRVANPPARRAATPVGAPGRPATTGRPATAPAAQASAPAPAPAIDTDLIESSVFKVVNPMFEELISLMKASQQTTIDCVTILGDIAGQTGGTFQQKAVDKDGNFMVREDGTFVMESPQLWTHPSKIFAHVEGVAFNPENVHIVEDDPVSEALQAEPEDVPADEVAEGEEIPEGEE